MGKKLIDREMTEAVVHRYLDYSNASMCVPWVGNYWEKQWVAATNGWAFILVPMHDGNRIEQTNGKVPPPNLGRVLPETFDLAIRIECEDLGAAIMKVPMVERKVVNECEACDGTGQFEHFGEDYECKSCNGRGKMKTDEIEKVRDPDTFIKIGECLFHHRFIYDLALTCQNTNETYVTLRYQNEKTVSIFELPNGILVGIAPTVGDVANVIELNLNEQ